MPPRAPRARRNTGQLAHQTPDDCLIFVKNVPHYLASHTVPKIFSRYSPIFTKNVHPELPTTTIVCGFGSSEEASAAQRDTDGMRVEGILLQVETYDAKRSVQVLKGRQHDKKHEYDEEWEDEEKPPEPQVKFNPTASVEFPALPGPGVGMRKKEKESAWKPKREKAAFGTRWTRELNPCQIDRSTIKKTARATCILRYRYSPDQSATKTRFLVPPPWEIPRAPPRKSTRPISRSARSETGDMLKGFRVHHALHHSEALNTVP